jgi:hypothetical protein
VEFPLRLAPLFPAKSGLPPQSMVFSIGNEMHSRAKSTGVESVTYISLIGNEFRFCALALFSASRFSYPTCASQKTSKRPAAVAFSRLVASNNRDKLIKFSPDCFRGAA